MHAGKISAIPSEGKRKTIHVSNAKENQEISSQIGYTQLCIISIDLEQKTLKTLPRCLLMPILHQGADKPLLPTLGVLQGPTTLPPKQPLCVLPGLPNVRTVELGVPVEGIVTEEVAQVNKVLPQLEAIDVDARFLPEAVGLYGRHACISALIEFWGAK